LIEKTGQIKKNPTYKSLESLAIMKLIDQRINKKAMYFIDDNLKILELYSTICHLHNKYFPAVAIPLIL